MKESQVVDLRKNITLKQSETSNAKSELKAALEVFEKLKTDLNTQRAGWENEKATLLKRAEDVEAALKPVTEELSGLKWHVNQMTAAIFGK
jgi:hypothetical protein